MVTTGVTIRRQVLQVDLRCTHDQGLTLQRRLPGVCADVLAPALESALAAYDPGEAYMVLDRLDLELTVTSLDRFDADLAEAVRRALVEHFRRRPRPVASTARGLAQPSDVIYGTPSDAAGDVLIIFLRTGDLPWWFRLPHGRTLEEFVLDAWRAAGGVEPPPALRRPLLDVLAIASARLRLVRQFSPTFAATVLGALAPHLATGIADIVAGLGRSPVAAGAGRFLRLVVQVGFEIAFETMTQDILTTGRTAFFGGAIADGSPSSPGTLTADTSPSSHGTLAVDGPASSPGSLVGLTLARADPSLRRDRALLQTLERHWPGSTRGGARQAPATHVTPPPSHPPEAAGANESDGVLVDHAGVVLLHPFLPRFFEGLGIAEGDELLEPERALCLLNHLVTGEPTAAEHRLRLAKALCDVPAEQPVEADAGLTAAETGEAAALLEAVTDHWEALRGSSPDALRVEFLQRPGVLSETDDRDWLLRVDARTVDILLDQLPWGYSSFRLPWMRRLMMVEWR